MKCKICKKKKSKKQGSIIPFFKDKIFLCHFCEYWSRFYNII